MVDLWQALIILGAILGAVAFVWNVLEWVGMELFRRFTDEQDEIEHLSIANGAGVLTDDDE